MLQFNQLSVNYQSVTALSDVSFCIDRPAIIGIIGPNGAGKSTLLKAALNLIHHTGSVTLQDKDLHTQLNKVAYVEQKIDIDYQFPINVKECVSLGLFAHTSLFHRLTPQDWQKVDAALDMVGLLDFKDRQISQLSGGQFQRVLLARCLVQNADYIFLDEPFVGIDSVSEEIIMSILRQLRDEGRTILIVHHDLNKVTTYFDQVLLLNKTLVAFGDTKDVFIEKNMKTAYGSGLFVAGSDLYV